MLALEVMRASDELRSPDTLTVARSKATPAEVKMARSLIESMSDTWDPTAHPDTYRKALEKLVAAKRTFAIEIPDPGAKTPEKVVDLMDALRKSLGQVRGGARKPGSRRRRAA